MRLNKSRRIKTGDCGRQRPFSGIRTGNGRSGGKRQPCDYDQFVQGSVEELHSNAYCFVLPSDIEGMALGLLEAMSYGNCCIASNIPENTEVAEDHALYFEKGNERDLQKRLEEVLAHPEQTQKAHQENADFICGKYNWDRVTEQTLHLYQHVLKARENQK